MPKRGWYIRLTAPSFPLGIFIPLMPVPAASPYHAEAALQFSTRINPPKSKADPAVQDRSSMTLPPSLDSSSKEAGTRSLDSASIHSYPPTPHTSPPMSARISTETVNEKDSQKTLSSSTMTSRVSPPDIQQFILAPHSSPHVPESENTSFIAKALSVLKNNKPSHTLSFTLCPIPPKLSSAGQVSISAESSHSQHTSGEIIPTPQPLLIFHDRTPVWNFRSTTGLLEIDTSLEREMGVDRSFWVTIALAYLEFQTEREVSFIRILHLTFIVDTVTALIQSYMAAAGG